MEAVKCLSKKPSMMRNAELCGASLWLETVALNRATQNRKSFEMVHWRTDEFRIAERESMETLKLKGRRSLQRPACKLVNAAEISPVLWLHTYHFW